MFIITGLNFGQLHAQRNSTLSSGYIAPLSVYVSWSDEFTFTNEDCMVTVPHTELQCITGFGVGQDLPWVVEVDSLANSLAATSYGAPELHSLTLYEDWICNDDLNGSLSSSCASSSSDNSFTVSTTGGDYVVLQGKNFGGRQAFIQYISFGPTATEYVLVDSTTGISECNLTVPHVIITCRVPPGNGKMHSWRIVIAGICNSIVLSGQGGGPYLNYSSPNITGVFPGKVGITSGGYEVTVTGNNYGPMSDISVYYWGRLLRDVVVSYVQDGILTFTMPVGQGGPHTVQLVQESDYCTGA